MEFRPKLIVSIVVLALVDHLRPKYPSSANPGGQQRAPRPAPPTPPFSKSMDPPLDKSVSRYCDKDIKVISIEAAT